MANIAPVAYGHANVDIAFLCQQIFMLLHLQK